MGSQDEDLLTRAYEVIRNDENLARQVIDAAENKGWAKVKAIVEDVLTWLGYAVQIAVTAIAAFFSVFGDTGGY